ncbi:hypothetical protein [Streptomyces sp. NPDC005209]|uniref:hypothetical protein n=1 Tax=Streptomyces sp. NPDC005209 TaxID=3156715 RepID=UPI0033B8B904
MGRTIADPEQDHAWAVSLYRLEDHHGHVLGIANVVVDVTDLPVLQVADVAHPLDKHTVKILRRWLDVRAGITKELEGTDPRLPVDPDRARGGVEPPKPGLTQARRAHPALRTPHPRPAGLRRPLRPYALLPRR